MSKAFDGLPLSAEMRPDSEQVDLNINDNSETYAARDAMVGGTDNDFSHDNRADRWRVSIDFQDGDADDSDDVQNAANWSESGTLSQSSLAS